MIDSADKSAHRCVILPWFIQGGGGTRIPNQGLEGGVWPKAEKKIVTSPILMAEVVVDVPKGTLDGSPGVQGVFELL